METALVRGLLVARKARAKRGCIFISSPGVGEDIIGLGMKLDGVILIGMFQRTISISSVCTRIWDPCKPRAGDVWLKKRRHFSLLLLYRYCKDTSSMR